MPLVHRTADTHSSYRPANACYGVRLIGVTVERGFKKQLVTADFADFADEFRYNSGP